MFRLTGILLLFIRFTSSMYNSISNDYLENMLTTNYSHKSDIIFTDELKQFIKKPSSTNTDNDVYLLNFKNNSVNNRDVSISKNDDEKFITHAGRTFGLRRRLQIFVLLAIAFKLGIIITLLFVVTTVTVKGLLIGLIILMLILLHVIPNFKNSSMFKSFHTPEQSNKNVHIHIYPNVNHEISNNDQWKSYGLVEDKYYEHVPY